MSEQADSLVGLLGRLAISSSEEREVVLPLTGVSVEADVVDFIGEVKISQSYRNSERTPVEAVYHFPIDEASSVCSFHAEYEDGSVVKGIVKEKGAAKEEYEHAKRSGRQANLLEVTRRDIFTINIGNLPPGGFVKISITYVTSLKAQNDAVAFILPTCVAPRYSPPNKSISSSEAEAMAPPSSHVKLFGLDMIVKFRCKTNIKSITSPTHAEVPGINYQTEGKTASVVLKDIGMDRDLVLLVEEDKPHQPRACVEVGENGSLAGFVTIFPKIEFKDIDREITFVIDRSGSMSINEGSRGGKSKIEQCRDALLLFLRALPNSCTFNVVGFGSTFDTLFDESKPYNDENLDTATRYVMQMGADMGGTEIRAPLSHILEQNVSSHISRQVFVLTDGQVFNDSEVFDVIRKHCSTTGKCRVFSLGIGAGVSRHLVEGMARAGRGTARFVEGSDASVLRTKVMGQLKQALQPALDDVSVDWSFPVNKRNENSDINTEPPPVKTLLGYRSPMIDQTPDQPVPRIFPSVNPPIFNQERFLSFVLFPKGVTEIPDSVTVKCNSPDGQLEVKIDISDEELFHGSIAHKMAARAAITEHEDARNEGVHSGSSGGGVISESEALQLALDNSLASNKTSFIAVKEEACVEPGTQTARRVIPQYTCSVTRATTGGDRDRMCFATKSARKSAPATITRTAGVKKAKRSARYVEKRRKKAQDKLDDKKKGHAQLGDLYKDAMVTAKMEEEEECFQTCAYSSPPSLPLDQLLQLCLLQKADGSFLLDDRLAAIIGKSTHELIQIADSSSPSSGKKQDGGHMLLFATILAIAVMHARFAQRREEWELQKDKATGWLVSQGLSESEVKDSVANLELNLNG